MSYPQPLQTFPDYYGYAFTLICLGAQLYAAPRLGVPKWLSRAAAVLVAVVSVLEHLLRGHPALNHARDWGDGLGTIWCLFWLPVGAFLFSGKLMTPPSVDGKRRAFLKQSATVACAVPAAVLGFGIVARKEFRTNEIDLKFPGLPKDLEGLRFVQISDVHLSAFYSRSDLARVVDACNELRAHVAFMTGDLITERGDPLDACLEELKRLKSDVGTLGCLGNHEMYARVQDYTAAKAASLGMRFLRSEAQDLRFGSAHLNVVGVDYQVPNQPLLTGVEDLVVPGSFNLLLSHTPAVFPVAARKKVDLMLSGHTHGGQLNLEIAGKNYNVVDLKTPYTKGKYELNGSTAYVNSGLGTIGVPVRLGAPAEISLIRLCAI